MRLTNPLFTIGALDFLEREAREITGRDLILIVGGLFLIAKATYEIHHKLEAGDETPTADAPKRAGRGARPRSSRRSWSSTSSSRSTR